jgi:tRNA(fMet)-specific endonuclease VapC
MVCRTGPASFHTVHEEGAETAEDAATCALQVMYLLDTNACIALINGTPSSVRVRLEKALGAGGQAFVSTVVIFELWYGVAKSAHQEANTRRLKTFLSGPVGLLSFEEADAEAAGKVRAGIEASGKPIGAYDLLIAGQALRHKLTLVTANVKEFRRVRGLAWEDWAKN